jgi:hypothetical protein
VEALIQTAFAAVVEQREPIEKIDSALMLQTEVYWRDYLLPEALQTQYST